MYLFRPPNIPIVFPIFIFRSQIQYHYHFLFIGLKKKSLEAANGINREVASHFFIRITASNLVSKITTKKVISEAPKEVSLKLTPMQLYYLSIVFGY